MKKVRIFVTYKESVFDPQGETITAAVKSLGFPEVKKIGVGKFFDITLSDEADLDQTIPAISEKLLVNFNLETYRYQVLEEQK
ncbi:MAG: phosphoribosylformylglycinamidine synthase subunit PurS [Liquorilactobacillus nagelii]|jgi:phosphoribosylformylglycinamidine synthase|uniref:Phosphoribosylformylglycinamidine synthase subunit PurS n=1 Tax=Liquorilactobacillus nagelii TaxID=82688 RepID=A0A3S6QWK5_9LACO|nr:phosphoribosylformylglycinamidine synthase subunit PurS [Liquorilactobacillus nagelii]AUJ32453.1 phosphoribosylformylglycinamidine synthase, purS protein [Liquorilactobacillus nagelii]MCC7615642.1 phosphoribosylformylglycinamidine synthase, purS protein [Liquorilactobacillus nagelii]MCI1634362.1 phosphoribosylformylglycinamidine synthase subunit PurS [Liquorilactobacillus nagelii]MCI1699251.1 phosphoribosylformylglycinamidine synthase subunit PurS [Liquorilactobacillus nagelii]MCI1922235.1 